MYVRDIWPRESIARGSRESGEIVFRGLASFRIPRRGDGGGGGGGADDIVAIENNRRALISLAQARAAGMIPPRYVSTAEELYDGSTAHSLSLSHFLSFSFFFFFFSYTTTTTTTTSFGRMHQLSCMENERARTPGSIYTSKIKRNGRECESVRTRKWHCSPV